MPNKLFHLNLSFTKQFDGIKYYVLELLSL